MPFLVYIFEFLGSFAGSRLGMAVLAFVAGWAVSSLKCDFRLDGQLQRIKTEHKAALEVEIARERAAAAEIAQAATERASDDQQTINELNDKIDQYSKQEASRDPKPSRRDPKTGQCLIDSMFVDIVRDLNKPGRPAAGRRSRRR